MTDRAAIAGTFADMKSVKTRFVVQMIVEIPIENAEAVVAMFGYPKPGAEVPVAVARLTDGPTRRAEVVSEQADPHPRRWEDMPPSQAAALAIQNVGFRAWLGEAGEVEADALLKLRLGVDSKADLDGNEEAAYRWRWELAKYRQHQTDERVAGMAR